MHLDLPDSPLLSIPSILQRTFGSPATLTTRPSAAGPWRTAGPPSGSSTPTGSPPSTKARRTTTQVVRPRSPSCSAAAAGSKVTTACIFCYVETLCSIGAAATRHLRFSLLGTNKERREDRTAAKNQNRLGRKPRRAFTN